MTKTQLDSIGISPLDDIEYIQGFKDSKHIFGTRPIYKKSKNNWQNLQKMIAAERANHREELKRKAEFRDLCWQIFGIIILFLFLVAGTIGIFIFAKFLKEQQA